MPTKETYRTASDERSIDPILFIFSFKKVIELIGFEIDSNSLSIPSCSNRGWIDWLRDILLPRGMRSPSCFSRMVYSIPACSRRSARVRPPSPAPAMRTFRCDGCCCAIVLEVYAVVLGCRWWCLVRIGGWMLVK